MRCEILLAPRALAGAGRRGSRCVSQRGAVCVRLLCRDVMALFGRFRARGQTQAGPRGFRSKLGEGPRYKGGEMSL
eukprot:5821137-Prymnesium_polylepis.2